MSNQAFSDAKKIIRRDNDPFVSDALDLLDGVALQIEFGDYDKKLQVAKVYTGVVLSVTAHDREDNLLFGVQLHPQRSTLSKNEPYRVNAFNVLIADDKVNYGAGFAGDLVRGDKLGLDCIRSELSHRIEDLLVAHAGVVVLGRKQAPAPQAAEELKL